MSRLSNNGLKSTHALAALCAVAMLATNASAALLGPQTVLFGPTLAGGPDIPLSFTQFNPATAGGTGGTLNSVTIDFAYTGGGGSFTWELLTGGGSIDVDYGVSVEIKPDTSAPIVPLGTVTPNPDAFTENANVALAFPIGPIPVPYSAAAGSGTGVEGPDAAYQGAGTFDILVDIADIFTVNSVTNAIILPGAADTVSGSVSVTYDYTPNVVAEVPEPSTLLLLGLGALLVPLSRRRRRS